MASANQTEQASKDPIQALAEQIGNLVQVMAHQQKQTSALIDKIAGPNPMASTDPTYYSLSQAEKAAGERKRQAKEAIFAGVEFESLKKVFSHSKLFAVHLVDTSSGRLVQIADTRFVSAVDATHAAAIYQQMMGITGFLSSGVRPVIRDATKEEVDALKRIMSLENKKAAVSEYYTNCFNVRKFGSMQRPRQAGPADMIVGAAMRPGEN